MEGPIADFIITCIISGASAASSKFNIYIINELNKKELLKNAVESVNEELLLPVGRYCA